MDQAPALPLESLGDAYTWDRLTPPDPSQNPLVPRPSRLVSLLDVLTFYAKSFLKQLKFVEEIERELEEDRPMAVGRSVSQLKELGLMAGQLGFQHLEDDGKRIFQLSSEGKVTREIALHESREFRRRLLEELARHMFFVVPATDRAFYEMHLLTLPTANSFPAADVELAEAGKCLSLDRHTAAVYHAMRALEVGLIALAIQLGVPMGNKPWGRLISDMEERITEEWALYRRSGYDQARQAFLELCSGAATHFRFLKDAWRNVVMHERQSYGREKAADILMNVKGFLEDLSAGGIHQQP